MRRKNMNDVIIECRGGVVQQVTLVGTDTRVFVIDWDEQVEAVSGGSWPPSAVQCSVESLAPETQALYEKAVSSI